MTFQFIQNQMDNISTDIDFDAIEEKHQKNLQLYQENGAAIVQPDPPVIHDLIPLSTKASSTIPPYPTKSISKGDYNCDPWEDMGWTDEFDKYSNESDPCGRKVSKPKNTYLKSSTWQANAWAESSDEEITPWGDMYSDDEAIYDNSNPDNSTSVFEKMEEIEVSTDKIAADIQEVSRDMGELVPLVSDTNEDVRNMATDVYKINRRVGKLEDSLISLHNKMDGVNDFLKIIVDHFNNE